MGLNHTKDDEIRKMIAAYAKPGKTYRFEVSRGGEMGVETIFLKEHELEQKHRDLLLGEAIRVYENLPAYEKEMFVKILVGKEEQRKLLEFEIDDNE